MPTYEYRCLDCHATWERTEHIAEHQGVTEHTAAAPRCPRCESDRVEHVFSAFFAKTNRKS